MALNIHQKSIYLTIYNATMIGRSVGKSFNKSTNINTNKINSRNFKIDVFKELDFLTNLLDTNELKEKNILDSLRKLSETYKISFGQAQKPINVILKNHYYLNKINNHLIYILHCPIDSIILKAINKSNLSLTKIDEKFYLKIQNIIENRKKPRIEFDVIWDFQHLKNEGLINKI